MKIAVRLIWSACSGSDLNLVVCFKIRPNDNRNLYSSARQKVPQSLPPACVPESGQEDVLGHILRFKELAADCAVSRAQVAQSRGGHPGRERFLPRCSGRPLCDMGPLLVGIDTDSHANKGSKRWRTLGTE
jgi:hypothetical protein